MLQGLGFSAARKCLDVPDCKASEWGFAKLPSLDSLFASVENGHESPFMDILRSSRTFHSPDCPEAMAELLHVNEALEGLQVGPPVPSSTRTPGLSISQCKKTYITPVAEVGDVNVGPTPLAGMAQILHAPVSLHQACTHSVVGVDLCRCGVQGSAFLPQKTAASRESVKELRVSLKSGIRAAWSHEALRRGIAFAKVLPTLSSHIVGCPRPTCSVLKPVHSMGTKL